VTARDRWEQDLMCPVCERTGTARVSQADGWEYQNDQSTRVDHIPDGFGYSQEPNGPPNFFCLLHKDHLA
jgi:hypothetical protein